MADAAREAGDCRHCGLPVATAGAVDAGASLDFCCFGCRVAFGLLRSADGAGDDAGVSSAILRFSAGAFLALNIMVFSWLSYSREWFGDVATRGEGFSAVSELFAYLLWLLGTAVFVLLGGPLLHETIERVRVGGRRHPGLWLRADSLILVGASAAWAISARNTLVGDGPLFFDSTAMILLALTLGRFVEAAARRRAGTSGDGWIAARIADACRLNADGSCPTTVPCESLRPGDLVRVAPGETVPIDGDLESDGGDVDDAMLTGEPGPRALERGDRVLAGAINHERELIVRVRHAGADRAVARMHALLEEARRRPTRAQRVADRIAAVFGPTVVAIAIAVGVAAAIGGRPLAGLWNGVAILIVSCPCALAIAAPLACQRALTRAARRGVLFRGAEDLERAASVDTVVFDKTGTLTDTDGAEVDMRTDGDPAATWALAATLAAESRHPAAVAIRSAALAAGARPATATDRREIAGVGTEANVGGRRLALGGPRLLDRDGVEAGAADRDAAVFLTEGSRIVASFEIRERLRPEAAEAVAALARDRRVEILTGDVARRAARVAESLGVPVRAGLLPQDKVAHVRELARSGRTVAVIGDGINDAPVLAAAHLGIAVSTASELARHAGRVWIRSSDLRTVHEAIRIARHATHRIRLALLWSFAYNAVGIVLAARGTLGPLFAASAMVASSLIVIALTSGAGAVAPAHDDRKTAPRATPLALGEA